MLKRSQIAPGLFLQLPSCHCMVPLKWADNAGFDIYFDISLKRRLHKPSNCRWLRRYNVHGDVIVMEEPFVMFNSVFLIRPIFSDIHTTYTHLITRLLCMFYEFRISSMVCFGHWCATWYIMLYRIVVRRTPCIQIVDIPPPLFAINIFCSFSAI